MGKTITIINQKGGVGKTTTTVSVGSALARKGYATLIIDCDGQCNAGASLGVLQAEVNTYSVFKGDSIKIIPIEENLFLLPYSINVSALDLEINEPGKEQILREKLEPIKDQFDYVLLDSSPNLNLVSVNNLVASDYFIVPLLPHHLSVHGVKSLLEVTEVVKRRINSKLELGGFVLSQFSSQKILHKDIAESIKSHFGDKLFKTTIRQNISLAEATSTGKSIFEYAPKSNGAADYWALTEEIIQKLK